MFLLWEFFLLLTSYLPENQFPFYKKKKMITGKQKSDVRDNVNFPLFLT
jgi:hypothetical protein